MLRYHMTVVTPDNRLRREIKRVTTATGSTATFLGDPSELDPGSEADLVIIDARRSEPTRQVLANLPGTTAISYVLDGGSLSQKLFLFGDARVCSLLCHDDSFDEDEFIASATKSLRGEVFGLQKYFPWGVTTFSMVVRNHDQKSRAIDILLQYAVQAGVRGPVRERLSLVADELMINALYHAPVDAQGNELYAAVDRKELAARDLQPIEVQYGCSGRYFGISVRDGGGSLKRHKAIEYLMRAQKDGAADIEDKPTGAGLGLQNILRSVSKLVFNIQPGRSTEVIALFDLDQFARGKVGARSLHMFMAPEEHEEEEEDDEPAAMAPAATTARTGSGLLKWVVVASLVAIVAAMGTAVLMKSTFAKAEGTPAPTPQLIVVPHPASSSASASITIKSQRSQGEGQLLPNQAFPLRGQDQYDVSVKAGKQECVTTIIPPADPTGTLKLYAPFCQSR